MTPWHTCYDSFMSTLDWALHESKEDSVIYRKGTDEVVMMQGSANISITLPVADIMYRTTLINTPENVQAYLKLHLSKN